MNARCRIELFGGLRMQHGDQIITRFRTRKTAELLAYLAYYRQRAHPREVLIELLWPECDVDAGRHSLSVALSALRAQLEPPGTGVEGAILVADRHCVGLNPALVTTDVAEFEMALKSAAHTDEAAQRAQALATAVELNGGEFLPGYYEDWIFPEQQRLEELFFQALRQLIVYHERGGDFDRALHYALRSVSRDRLREEAHREVIRLYIAAGQPEAALSHYRELERLLKAEMEVTPDADTRALLDVIRSRASRPEAPESASAAAESCRNPSGPTDPLRTALPTIRSEQLEPVGGAVPLDSKFYIVRSTDAEFHAAIARRDCIVMVKGARQVGKTSLLARGLQQAREAGAQVVLTHFQTFNAAHLESAESLLLALADAIADQLDLEVLPTRVWEARRGPNPNFRRYLRREVLEKLTTPLVWGLDEVDRLFSCPFGGEIFGLFRSWHDERTLEPDGPWSRLTLAIVYSTEAHLFITDMNQSPFNVGTRLTLEDFTREQIADLHRRYGTPLREEAALDRYYALVSGQPYLVRRGLHEMAAHGIDIAAFEARAGSDDWIFGEHLRRIRALLARDADLTEAVREVLKGRACPDRESFYRLRSAGVMSGESVREARFRCPLYATYLEQHLL
jgi:DNA-binding SARP family transcriptional activator